MMKTAVLMIALLLLMTFARAEEQRGGNADAARYDAYFDDAVFVGDSLTRQLRNYVSAEKEKDRGTLGGARFLATANFTLYAGSLRNVTGDARLRYRGADVTVHGGLKAMGAKKAFVLLGVNDHAGSQLEKDVRRYGVMIDHILEACPGITLVCQSMSPVQEHRQSKTLNKKNLDAFNARVEALCAQKGVVYLDIATPLMNEKGFLRGEYAASKGDNVHLNDRGVAVWVDTLRAFARAQYESGAWTPGEGESGE